MLARIGFWFFFVLSLVGFAALGWMVWEGTRPTRGASMVFMGLPFILGPLALFLGLTYMWSTSCPSLEKRIGKVAVILGAAALVMAFLGIGFL